MVSTREISAVGGVIALNLFFCKCLVVLDRQRNYRLIASDQTIISDNNKKRRRLSFFSILFYNTRPNQSK